MGLIKAIAGAIGGGLADQWKEFFYCDSIPSDTLVVRGKKQTTSRTSNTKGNDNIISNGSIIAVADGQAMAIVEQGKVVEFCAEPGEFKWDSSTEPSIFAGNLGKSIIDSFKQLGRRIGFGGDTAKDQRVYYFNLKEITDNKFGTANPIPFRIVVNEELGFKLSADLRVSGVYSFKVVDPIILYTNVTGNVASEYKKSELESMMKGELLTALQPALARIAAKGIQYYEIPAHATEVRDELRVELTDEWMNRRGLQIESFNPSSLTIPEDQRKKLTEWEENAMTVDPRVAGSRLVGATSDAMRIAAGNEGGALNGFIGLNAAGGMTGATGAAANFYAIGAEQQAAKAAADAWDCPVCGKKVSGKFCSECGSKKPEAAPAAGGWTCTCGQVNSGNFCTNCGAKKPESSEWFCPDCGTKNVGNFCTNCGKKKA